jgi:predicted NodU family carbamoyl transferase
MPTARKLATGEILRLSFRKLRRMVHVASTRRSQAVRRKVNTTSRGVLDRRLARWKRHFFR